MKKLTVESLAKKIELQNEKFNSATKEEKIVMIVKDCLDRIELNQIIITKGNFCNLDTSLIDVNLKSTLATTNTAICSACAKGSLFMSYIGRVNNYITNKNQFGNSEEDLEHRKLLEIFSLDQLALIEMAFEGQQYIDKLNRITNVKKITQFRKRVAKKINLVIEDEYDSDFHVHTAIYEIGEDGEPIKDYSYEGAKRFSDAVMESICKNIIRNKGKFVI